MFTELTKAAQMLWDLERGYGCPPGAYSLCWNSYQRHCEMRVSPLGLAERYPFGPGRETSLPFEHPSVRLTDWALAVLQVLCEVLETGWRRSDESRDRAHPPGPSLLQCATGTPVRRSVRGEAGRHNCSEGEGGLEGAMATLQSCGVRAGPEYPDISSGPALQTWEMPHRRRQ